MPGCREPQLEPGLGADWTQQPPVWQVPAHSMQIELCRKFKLANQARQRPRLLACSNQIERDGERERERYKRSQPSYYLITILLIIIAY